MASAKITFPTNPLAPIKANRTCPFLFSEQSILTRFRQTPLTKQGQLLSIKSYPNVGEIVNLNQSWKASQTDSRVTPFF
jgi:hypothetical protein